MQAATRQESNAAASSAERLASATKGSGAPARALVIEDEPGIVDFVRRGMEAEGFSVTSAADGREGERLALAGGFDVVILDLMLPGRGGLQILASLQRAPAALP